MDYLKKLRKQKGITQKEIAEKIGISSSYYIKVEDGFLKPSYNLLSKLKKYYGSRIDLNKFFE